MNLSNEELKALVAVLQAHGVKDFEMTDTSVKISYYEPMPKLVQIQANPLAGEGPSAEDASEDPMLYGGNPPPAYRKPTKEELRRADPESADWPEDD